MFFEETCFKHYTYKKTLEIYSNMVFQASNPNEKNASRAEKSDVISFVYLLMNGMRCKIKEKKTT